MSKQLPAAFVTLNEFRNVTPKLARVSASMTQMRDMTQDEVFDAISAKMPNGVNAVRSSFVDVGNGTYVGFAYSAPQMRLMNDDATMKDVTAGRYKEVAKNIYVDASDDSLWDVKKGAGGNFLMRQGTDDLSKLLETARVSPSGNTVRLSQVASAAPTANQFVSFVRDGVSHSEMDYGVVLSKTSAVNYVLSMASQSVVAVTDERVVCSASLVREHLPKLPAEAIKRHQTAAAKRGVTAAAGQVAMTPEEYWRNLYSYNPDYMNQVLDQVRGMAHA